MVTLIVTNLINKPDFIAYSYHDRHNIPYNICKKLWNIQGVSWTLKSQQELDTAIADNEIVIFDSLTKDQLLEIVDLLLKSGNDWEFTPDYESDIAKEHEKYITEYYNSPVFITNWPKDIKAWYMKVNEDGKTVAAVDLEVPGAGELMGGSQREENYEVLMKRIEELGVNQEAIDWYMNLRRYGGCYHSGFGMGFERLLMYLTGIENIRDSIPFPRTPGNCEY